MSGPSGDARVPMLPVDEARAIATDGGVPAEMAELSIFRVLLRHPRLARAFNDLLGMLLFRNTLPHRLRELVIMRIGWVTGSEYEWGQHWRVGHTFFDVPAADLAATRDWQRHDGFDAADRAVLAATDEVLERGAVSAATWDACIAAIPAASPEERDHALLELFMAIGAWRMVSGVLRSLEVPIEDFTESWPPDGTPPDASRVHG
ncbi:MAG TPA: carboxymuconolactone decarboxylase family protein [Acidimicrobiia bacterium]|nr:carboxymuconolactone decarboxylase family protein [Acidimicrobiia bacterium]